VSHPWSRSSLDALSDTLSELAQPLRQRYSDIAVHLTPPEGVEVLAGETLRDPEVLRATLQRFSANVGTDDPRIVGVHWLGQLGYAVLPPVEMALTRGGIGIDASLDNILIVQPNGSPAQIVLRDPTRMVVYPQRGADMGIVGPFARTVASPDELRAYVLDGLFGNTFGPLVDAVHAMTGVSLKVLWGQVAYEAELFLQTLVRYDEAERTPAWEDDWAAVFDREYIPALTGPNPLCRPTRMGTWVDPETGESETYPVRTVCCLIYKVDVDRMCGACPLGLKEESVLDKLATIDERKAERAVARD
jgi:hypothetical protein